MANKTPTKSAADEKSYILEGHAGNQQVNTKYSKSNKFRLYLFVLLAG
jgi:hypothetical protein